MRQRLRIEIQGAVQGVGFRPFVYRLAADLDVAGWVINGASGVVIEVEGSEAQLAQFADRLVADRPPRSVIGAVDVARLDPVAASRIEPGNERRIVRALEVCEGSGQPFSSFGPGLTTYPDVPTVQIGLRVDRSTLVRNLALLERDKLIARDHGDGGDAARYADQVPRRSPVPVLDRGQTQRRDPVHGPGDRSSRVTLTPRCAPSSLRSLSRNWNSSGAVLRRPRSWRTASGFLPT